MQCIVDGMELNADKTGVVWFQFTALRALPSSENSTMKQELIKFNMLCPHSFGPQSNVQDMFVECECAEQSFMSA